jgi:anti-sigma factor RsiW
MDRSAECEHSEQMTGLMSLTLDGLQEGSDQQRLEQHIESCSSCRAEWEAMQQVSALFDGSTLVGPPLGFAVRVERRLAEKTKQQRQLFGGLAVLTSSLSLAGVTVAVVVMIVMGIFTWRWLDSTPAVQQGAHTVTEVASGVGLMGKAASSLLGDLLLRYGAPLVLLLGIGLMVLLVVWAWLFLKRPGGTRHNGFA